MGEFKELLLEVSLIVVAPLLAIALWMSVSCSQKAEMGGYRVSKIVAMKCYGTNDGVSWKNILF